MRYKLLGRSGLRVSELCLGAMTFGTEWGWGASLDESHAMFDAFIGAGGNFVDTANMYTNGTSEQYVGQFIRPARDSIVLATKYTVSTNPSDPNAPGNHRKNMVQSLEASLKRLGTHYVDLYWVHAWDALTPVDEILRGLDDLVRAGKILYIGISDTPAWQVSRANMLATVRGWSTFVALQIPYSLIERTCERELLPMARELDLAVTPWGLLGGGILSGKYNPHQAKTPQPSDARLAQHDIFNVLNDRNIQIAQETAAIAKEIGESPSQVAINWVRQQAFDNGGVIVPILGARNVAHLRDNIECLEFTLDRGQMDRLTAVSQIDMGFPQDFLNHTKAIFLGEKYPLIDDHRHGAIAASKSGAVNDQATPGAGQRDVRQATPPGTGARQRNA
jgi:aryl-alcohol dehydrogenase-like predicted oxidoreductase